ncbi:hypothetical protein [Rhizobium leguminosarum]|uniref:hypothetical protein n=1 Tax=Rhizobium leguminosarum TaxID=384 RepID=UPI003F95675A
MRVILTAWATHRKAVGLAPVANLDIIQHTTPDIHRGFQQGTERAKYTHAVIDGPPRADEALSRSAIAPCDVILIPVQPSLADLWASRATVTLVKAAQASGLKVKAAFLLSRLKPHTNIGRDFVDVLKEEGLPVLPAATHDRTAYAAALSSCQTILEFEPPSGKAYQEMLSILAAVKKLK